MLTIRSIVGHDLGMWQRRRKFGGVKTQNDGYSFASKLESALYTLLKEEMAAGIWIDIKTQVQTYLTDAEILYKPDFMTTTPEGVKIYHESKGFKTPVYAIKKRLWKYYGPGKLIEYSGSYKKLVISDVIEPKVKKS